MSSSASDGGEVGNDPRSSSDSLPGSVGSDTSDGGDLSSSSSSSSNMTTPSPANTPGELSSSSASASSSSDSSSSSSSASSSSSGSSSLGIIEASGSGLGAGAIVGITIGALAVLLVIILIIRRRRRARRLGKDSTSSHNPTDPTTSENAGFTGDFTAFQHPDVIVKADYAQFPGVPFAPVKQVKFASSVSSTAGMWEDPEIVAVRIPKDKVHYQSLISRGAYGEVYRGSYNGQPVAIKMLLPETRKDLNLINSFLAEAKLTSTMDHPRVVSFVGVAWDSLTDLCVVSEFMEGGDLRALLSLYESTRQVPTGFNADKTRIALHVAHALTYLHSLLPMVLHRDLKSRNILLDSELNAKLTDFGVSRESSDRTMTAGIGTLLWMAPEVMMGERYDDKADMFSFGVVLAELDSHSLPYAFAKRTDSGRVLPDAAMLQLVALGQLSIRFSDDVPDEIAALGRACTSLDPTQRPTAGEALYELQKAQKRYVAESW